MKNLSALLLLAIFLSFLYLIDSRKQSPNITSTQAQQHSLPTRTKESDCIIQNSLPDSGCTPGAVFPGISVDQLCQTGYTKKVRNVSKTIKNLVFSEYGIYTHQPGEYEVDHLIPLELGGSNDVANLWPESADPRPGFHEKDQVENYLHDQVCSGRTSLSEAQYQIATNWVQVFNQIKN